MTLRKAPGLTIFSSSPGRAHPTPESEAGQLPAMSSRSVSGPADAGSVRPGRIVVQHADILLPEQAERRSAIAWKVISKITPALWNHRCIVCMKLADYTFQCFCRELSLAVGAVKAVLRRPRCVVTGFIRCHNN